MTYRLIHLLDDRSLGGVNKMLAIFNSEVLAEVSTSAFDYDAIGSQTLAPRYDADVIVLHAPIRWAYLPFILSLRWRNRKAKIVHVEHHYSRAFEALHVKDKGRFRALLRIASEMFDAIVCVSNAQAEWFREAVPTCDRKLWSINPHTQHPGLCTLPVPDFHSGSPLRIGAFGRFDAQKGFDLLIPAFKAGAFGASQLLIGGYGPDEGMLHALAEGHPDIEFFGKVEDVREFLARCDVVAVPSRREPFGLVCLEARQAGRPILVSGADALPDQAEGCGAVLDFSDHDQIRQIVSALTPNLLQVFAASARASTFGLGVEIQAEWIRLLHNLTHTPKRPAPPLAYFPNRPRSRSGSASSIHYLEASVGDV